MPLAEASPGGTAIAALPSRPKVQAGSEIAR